MELSTAKGLIHAAIGPEDHLWADLGAGTGLFTEALLQILPETGIVHALDKSPRYLYDLWRSYKKRIVVHDGDFTREMDLPMVDGILMANALHYVQDHESVLRHILEYLKPGGKILMIEYDTDQANPPWVPFPLSNKRWVEISRILSLDNVGILGKVPSRYGYDSIYASLSKKRG